MLGPIQEEKLFFLIVPNGEKTTKHSMNKPDCRVQKKSNQYFSLLQCTDLLPKSAQSEDETSLTLLFVRFSNASTL